LKMDWE